MAKKINTGDNPLFGGLNVPKKVSNDVKVNKNINDDSDVIEKEYESENIDKNVSGDVNRKVNITENKNVNVNENINNDVKLVINKAEKTEQPERFTYLLYKRQDKELERLAKQANMGKNEFIRTWIDEGLSRTKIE